MSKKKYNMISFLETTFFLNTKKNQQNMTKHLRNIITLKENITLKFQTATFSFQSFMRICRKYFLLSHTNDVTFSSYDFMANFAGQ